MKLLDGSELAEFIKERQVHQVRGLRQAALVQPRLAVVRSHPNPVADSYLRLQQDYGADILIDVRVHTVDQADMAAKVAELNADSAVHGIVIQLPLEDATQTDRLLNLVAAEKDVDGLATASSFEPATPLAIDWLLAGYNIELRGKKLVIIGQGRLVGKPLAARWRASGLDVLVADVNTEDIALLTRQADVLVSAVGVPNLITAAMVKPSAVIVDASVATVGKGLVGDVASDVRQLPTITITPESGGVGPLTVGALFDNVIRAARTATESTG